MNDAGNANRIHFFGAAGVGVTTLGKEVAAKLEIPHFDSDDYGWEPTNPPFQKRLPVSKRVQLLPIQCTHHLSNVGDSGEFSR